MDKDIIAIIEEKKQTFSKSQRQIAKYILENFDKAAFMTAAKFGKAVGVSESTVVRFAVDLGYDGYPEMKKAMQEMIRNRLTSVQRIEVAREIIGDDISASVMQLDRERIRTTIEELDKKSFDMAVKKIHSAKNIYIIGTRTSSMLASFLGFYLSLLFENVKTVNTTSVSELFEQMLRVSDQDVVIGISFPRYSRRTIKVVQFARDMGATVISITDSAVAPLAKLADINLFAKSDAVSFVDSLVAPLSLINALIVAIGTHSEDELSCTFERLEHIWDEYEVYEKNEG